MDILIVIGMMTVGIGIIAFFRFLLWLLVETDIPEWIPKIIVAVILLFLLFIISYSIALDEGYISPFIPWLS